MAQLPKPEEVSYLSTSVVSKALGLAPNTVRSMIDIGSLPAPQWMSLGGRVERIYSLEWLVLAAENVNMRRLPGFEEYIAPDKTVQFAVRFQQSKWSVEEVVDRLAAIQALWDLSAELLSGDSPRSRAKRAAMPGDTGLPVLYVRRLAAGSPLDLLAWASDNWQGLVGTGGVASLFIYLLRHPDRVGEAIPRVVASWHGAWGDAADSKVKRLKSKARLIDYEAESERRLRIIDARPQDTSLSGRDVRRLENETPAIDSASSGSPKALPPVGAGDAGKTSDDQDTPQ